MQALSNFLNKRITLCIAAAVLVILYVVYNVSYSAGLASLREEADRRLEQISHALFVPVDKFSYLPEFVANQSGIIETLLNARNPAYINNANAYLENINEIAKVEAIYLLDKQGLTLAASNWNKPSSYVGHNYSFRPYYQDAIKGAMGRFYALGTTSKTPGYYLSYPVKVHKKIIGVVVVKVDLSDFDREWRDDNGYEVTVTDEHGINFLSSEPDWKYRPMRELAPVDIKNLQHTRKYDSSLKIPLPVEERKSLNEDSQYLVISQPDKYSAFTVKMPYVVKTGKLSWSSWNINVFMQAHKLQGKAMMHTLMAAALLAFILLVLLYWAELRRRVTERESAKRAIEAAHSELEEKHRQLEVVSEELLRLATVDELTGSYNRRFFFEITAKMLSGVLRHNFALSIIVIDIDYFKRINDEYGHIAGDNVLKQVSRICEAGLRVEDVFARLGGEEFVMALMPTSEQDALDIAERLRVKIMNHQFVSNNTMLKVTISCGVAQFHPSDTSIEGTILRADQALYEAKRSGRNQVVVATSVENGSLQSLMAMQLC